MKEVEFEEEDFSNIIFNNQSKFLNDSFEFEFNDLINDKNCLMEGIEENISLVKKIPKIFPKTNQKISLTKVLSNQKENIDKFVKENEKEYEKEETNIISFNIQYLQKNNSKIYQNSFSRKTTDIKKGSSKIEIFNIILGEESRTLILIDNLSNKFNKKKFQETISLKGFKNKFDFIYFHTINSKSLNIYINFVNKFHIISFYEAFYKKKLDFDDKIINLKFCNIQPSDLKVNMKKNNIIENHNYDYLIEIPINYLTLFKKIYPKSVCIIKEENLYNDGNFVVKKF